MKVIKRYIGKSAAVTLVALLPVVTTGCVKRDLEEMPDEGSVVVSTFWGNLSEEAPVPENFIIGVMPHRQAVDKPINIYEELLTSGTHEMLVFNEPEGITVTEPIASVNVLDKNAISPLPGYLYSGIKEFTITKLDTTSVNVEMRQLVRCLDFSLEIKEGNHSRIQSMTATLSGAVKGVNLATAERSAEHGIVTVPIELKEGKLTFRYRLLGIAAGATPMLTVDILFTNGDTQQIVSDLSGQLAKFNEGVAPMLITGDVSLPVEKNSTGNISGWNVVDGGDYDLL